MERLQRRTGFVIKTDFRSVKSGRATVFAAVLYKRRDRVFGNEIAAVTLQSIKEKDGAAEGAPSPARKMEVDVTSG